MSTVAAIRLQCPHCNTRIKANPRCAGGNIRCPAKGCGLFVSVPTTSTHPVARTATSLANKTGRDLPIRAAVAVIGLILVSAIAILFVAGLRREWHAQAQLATLREKVADAEGKLQPIQKRAAELDQQLRAEEAKRQQQDKLGAEAGRKLIDLERDLEKTSATLKAERDLKEAVEAREAKIAAELADLRKERGDSGNIEATPPDCHYLCVGVDNYTFAGRLSGCLNDAKNIAACFQSQQSQRFAKTSGAVLLDGNATQASVAGELNQLKNVGKRGDFVVIFLSGHGTQQSGRWYFLPVDYQGNRHDTTSISDEHLLNTAHHLADRGLKTLVIIDACFAGHIRHAAKNMLNDRRYSDGGIVLMMSSMPSQTSKALGQYSAFAQAVNEGLQGRADLDGDGYVSMREIRRYAYHRTSELCRDAKQDGECDYSLSISENMRLAKVLPNMQTISKIVPPAVVTTPNLKNSGLEGAAWVGSETLQGYGQIEFRFEPNQVAVMVDRDGSSYGRWTRTNNQVRLTFYNGTVIYDGVIEAKSIAGTARNPKGNWTWKVAR